MSQQTNDRELSLLRMAQEDNEEAFEELLARYTPLIDSMTAGFQSTEGAMRDRDDLRQEALIAFYRAVTRFDASQDEVRFGLFAKDCIRNRLISHLRKNRKYEQVVSLDAETAEHAEDGSSPADQMVEREAYLTLYRQVEHTLSEYENRVWWMYLSGRTAKEIAAAIGTNERSVQNAVYRIRKKLRSVIPNP